MEYVVLGLLVLQNLTLYEINREFKQGISLFYSASYGSLQAAVKNLLGKGWVTCQEVVENGRNKKIYQITLAGREAFFTWMLEEIAPSKLEVTALAKVYFLGLVPDERQKKHILKGIITRITAVLQELEQLESEVRGLSIPETYREIAHYRIKTLHYGIGSHRFALAWAQEMLQELETAK